MLALRGPPDQGFTLDQKTDRVKSTRGVHDVRSRARIDPDAIGDADRPALRRRLLAATLARSGESVADVIASAQRAAIPAPEILTSLVGGVAAELGQRWLEDDLTFLDVTIASSKLHRAIHELRNATRRSGTAAARRVLFTTVPGEQHALGAAAAEHLAWQAGFDTRLDVRGNRDIDDGAAVGFDAVAIAVPCDRTLERLGEMVHRLRAGIGSGRCGIYLGGALATDHLARDVGADGCARGVDELLARFA